MPRITRWQVKAARDEAAAQNGNQCCYCDRPMWADDPITHGIVHGVALDQIWCFQCTTEHIIARGDHGSDEVENIAAACRLCNQVRSEIQPTMSFFDFRAYVQLQIQSGTWQLRTTSRRACRIRVKNGPLLSKLIAAHQATIDQSQASLWIDLDDGEIGNLKFASLTSSLWWSAGDQWRTRIFALADKFSDARSQLFASPTFNDNEAETIAVNFSRAEYSDLIVACKTSILRNGDQKWTSYLDTMVEKLRGHLGKPQDRPPLIDNGTEIPLENKQPLE